MHVADLDHSYIEEINSFIHRYWILVWYYARNRHTEGDVVLVRLNDAPVESLRVQETRLEILMTIEAELEASASLHWKQFVTFGIVDKTPLRIMRRLSIYL
jgi:hypothetical protein